MKLKKWRKNAHDQIFFQDKIRLLQDDLEGERELRQRVSSEKNEFFLKQKFLTFCNGILSILLKKRFIIKVVLLVRSM